MVDHENATLIMMSSTYGLTFFTETVKFLYAQATEVLKARRERTRAAGGGSSHEQQVTARAGTQLPDIFDGKVEFQEIDFAALEPVADLLNDLRKQIGDYAQATEELHPDDRDLLESLEAIRGLLEVVYSQRITFKGEQRRSSGPLIRGAIDVGEIAGYAVAVRSRVVVGGTVVGQAKAERVASGGQLVGVEVDTIKPDR